ncbi:hypothetical protein ACS5NO_17465 [Larkinella sp. GY13]|uniref:hypothetical protein n=1 Tax=Larkinella sp. GY13 TaxID=3453720 RepID=UPI003EEDA56B
MAQSKEEKKQSDSLAVVRDFVDLAKPLLDSLTKLHYIRKDVAALQVKVILAERNRDQLAVELKNCIQDNGKLANELFDTKDELGRQKQKNRQAQLERWLLRIGGAVALYFQVRSVL